MQSQDFSDVISQLPKFQRRLVIELLGEKEAYLSAAETYFLTSGPDNMQPFGGEPFTSKESKESKKALWPNFLKELNKLICGHPEYSTNREEFFKESDTLRTIIITNVSAYMGIKFGIPATYLAPIIVLIVCAAIKVGKNAYCSTYYDEMEAL
ncbi:hypothetical protein [Sphaerochaeta globosa]|uniref:Uncharacterized protein n=1 Tax=Sphaerochaeta globosa (strain ATCC BAA-1886 / DSM 22777 / Buddy) TaxID=158189 RepID=F0RZJ7_SPHGB|nr:hypothetical protein [Sphaerochaeta globosa]ADY13549.1 hypothetical protein SpiBuddy_1724 [Sphaerochaeta globosa str. Buddy]